MWDRARDTPALLQPGYRVRFIDAGPPPAAKAASTPATGADPSTSRRAGTATPSLEVVAPGLQALFQDLGRPGQARPGGAAAGAMDRGALRAANRLVGNQPGQACIEIVRARRAAPA
ncbi:hypothetical protein G6F23_014137 [Rhizopus arrhizus]|nr:hypothetical protein G6F23_014137 [Rhizopus arrhizus]